MDSVAGHEATESSSSLVYYKGIVCNNEAHHDKTGHWGCPARSDTNRAVQPQKMVRGLKFRI